MFEPGTILFFPTFYFTQGHTPPKPKYFIVLTQTGQTTILATLPSSQKHQYHLLGCLKPTLLQQIIQCLKNSAAVKRRFKRFL